MTSIRSVATLFTCLLCTVLTSGAVLTPSNAPPDLPVYNGTVVTSVCGSCCQRSSYCGSTASDTVIAADDPPLSEGDVIPKGTNMTCYLQDRSAAGSVDGGLCIPNLDRTLSGTELEYFCSQQTGAALLDSTQYQADLQPMGQSCQACCNGTMACGSGYTCYQSALPSSFWYGACVPTSVPLMQVPGYCVSQTVNWPLYATVIECETCSSLTTQASALQQQALDGQSYTGAPGSSR